jgi:hypothetical protein
MIRLTAILAMAAFLVGGFLSTTHAQTQMFQVIMANLAETYPEENVPITELTGAPFNHPPTVRRLQDVGVTSLNQFVLASTSSIAQALAIEPGEAHQLQRAISQRRTSAAPLPQRTQPGRIQLPGAGQR